MNTDAPWPSADEAWARVLRIQTKLHQWATDDSNRRFDDLYNLVCDPHVLVDAWHRVRGNRGARSAGVDGRTAFYISPCEVRNSSSPNCGPISRPGRSSLCPCASG